VAAGVDVQVHAEHHAGGAPVACRDRAHDLQLFGGFHVEAADPPGEPQGDLVIPLADTAEGDGGGRKSRLERQVELAARADVGPEALAGDQPQERPVGVGLDRVVRQMRGPAEGFLEMAAVVQDGLLAVDVERRAELPGRVAQVQLLAQQDIPGVLVFVHGSGQSGVHE
jgi:hypothetical protein